MTLFNYLSPPRHPIAPVWRVSHTYQRTYIVYVCDELLNKVIILVFFVHKVLS